MSRDTVTGFFDNSREGEAASGARRCARGGGGEK